MRIDYRRLERMVRGVANHRRIQMLVLLNEEGGLDLISIARRLNINIKTAGEHTRRLFIAGHVEKKNRGVNVIHSISVQGQIFLRLLLSFVEPSRTGT